MEWIILFLVSWILFFALVDWRMLKRNIWCGAVAVALQLLVDTTGINYGFYEIKNSSLNIWGSSVWFILGPVFVIGVLISQYHPSGYKLRIVNVFMLTALYSVQELLLVLTKALVYTNWTYVNSLQVNVSALVLLSWFSIVVVGRER